MHPVICRTLRHEYRLHAPSPAIARQLRFIEAAPSLPDFELAPVDIPIAERDGFIVATLPDGELVEGTPTNLINVLHRVVLTDIVEHNFGCPLLHGATVLIDGRRLLIVGHKGAGKSTLALHLALAGHQVEGDEHLIVRPDSVVARPRSLRVKDGTLTLLGPLPPAISNAPAIPGWDGSFTIRSFSPSVGGRDWIIRTGQLSGIIILIANHGGRSQAQPMSGMLAFSRLMGEIMLPKDGVAAAAGRVRTLALSVPAYQLSLGDLGTATWHLQHIANLLT